MTFFDIVLIVLTPGMLLSLFYVTKEFKGFIDYRKDSEYDHTRLTFLYAAREVSNLLQNSIDSVREACRDLGVENFSIKAVVGKDNGLTLVGAKLIIVPSKYKCNSLFKARQLNYALNSLPNSDEEWILHLDEDAKIIPQTIISILRYIRTNGNPIANGPTLFPYTYNLSSNTNGSSSYIRKLANNLTRLLTFFVEAQRAWTYYWCKWQMKTSAPVWANGSNLLVRSDLEQLIGWNFSNKPNSNNPEKYPLKFSEDTRFVYEVNKAYGSVFGWHGGLTLEQHPATIKSAITQRMRWYWGGILQMRHVDTSNPFRLPRRIYSSVAWFLGFVLTVTFPIGLILTFTPGLNTTSTEFFSYEIYHIYGISSSLILWSFRYQFGLWNNLRVSDISFYKKILMHGVLIPLSPIVEFVCTVPTVLALVNRPGSFKITAKNGAFAAEKIKETRGDVEELVRG